MRNLPDFSGVFVVSKCNFSVSQFKPKGGTLITSER